jgi:FkbM family methyltransferase
LPSDDFSHYVPFRPKILYGFLRIKRGDVVVDVGAFPGDFTLHASSLVGESGKVIAIEAHPWNFALLKANVILNDLRNVILVNKAISDREGKALLAGSGSGAHLSRSEGVEVKTTTLDKLLQDLGLARADVIKLDIEGAEVAALKGFQRLREVREAAIETHGTSSFRYVTECLPKKDFDIYVLNNSLLLKNIARTILNLPDFVLTEFKSKFLAFKLLSKYILGLENHPLPSCRSHQVVIVYIRRQR